MKKKAFALAMVALGLLAAFGLATYAPALPRVHVTGIPAEGERTIVLEVLWGGDTYTSTEMTCDIWTGQFNCELRRGGDLGTVMTQTLPLVGPLASADPPDSGGVVTTTLTWSLSDLTVGPYETFCRFNLASDDEEILGYIEGEGQDGQGFYMADKFAIGQTCIVPRRFQAWVQ